MLVPNCFDYYSFVIQLKSVNVCLQLCSFSGFLWSFVFPYKFYGQYAEAYNKNFKNKAVF